MTLDEIEERVKHSLEVLNSPEELYDWRLTHYSQPAWANLEEGCYWLSEGDPEKMTEATLKVLIKAFRDRCHISYIDFHIKVPEPGVAEFRRMVRLFGLTVTDGYHPRLVPPRDADTRAAYREAKVISAMRLTMEHKQVISEKLRQQFTYLVIRSKVKTPALLAVSLKFESYNSYQKKLDAAPTVALRNHFMPTIEDTTSPAPTPAPKEPMFAPMVTDNSSFESRLPPTQARRFPGKKGKVRVNGGPLVDATFYPIEPDIDFPHEMPAQVHEEFAAYCQALYEKRGGK